MKKTSLRQQKRKRTVWTNQHPCPCKSSDTYLVRIIQVQDPASRFVDILVTIVRTSHRKSCVHMNVVTRKIQRNQSLEDERPAWESGREEDE